MHEGIGWRDNRLLRLGTRDDRRLIHVEAPAHAIARSVSSFRYGGSRGTQLSERRDDAEYQIAAANNAQQLSIDRTLIVLEYAPFFGKAAEVSLWAIG
jgi:hypothetical protein